MSLLKDETTVRLDALTSLTDETMTFFEDLIGEIEDGSLGTLLSDHIREQRALLESVVRYRQSRGELPQAGDVERGHLFAAMASARRFFAENDSPVVDTLIESNARVREVAVAVRDSDVPPGQAALVRRIADACDAFEARLREHASTGSG